MSALSTYLYYRIRSFHIDLLIKTEWLKPVLLLEMKSLRNDQKNGSKILTTLLTIQF